VEDIENENVAKTFRGWFGGDICPPGNMAHRPDIPLLVFPDPFLTCIISTVKSNIPSLWSAMSSYKPLTGFPATRMFPQQPQTSNRPHKSTESFEVALPNSGSNNGNSLHWSLLHSVTLAPPTPNH